MTERERWVVYPLLFLALGAALRDKLFNRTTNKSIVCEELVIVDGEPMGGRTPIVLARIGRADGSQGRPPSGEIKVQGVVNALQYEYRGVPFVPTMRSLPTGMTWRDLFRSFEQAARRQQQQQQQQQQDAAAAEQAPSQPVEASSPAERPPPEPLADPADSR